jgi:hypothetical protein
MIVAHKFDMEIQSTSFQTRLDGERNRILRQLEEKPPEGGGKRSHQEWGGDSVPGICRSVAPHPDEPMIQKIAGRSPQNAGTSSEAV